MKVSALTPLLIAWVLVGCATALQDSSVEASRFSSVRDLQNRPADPFAGAESKAVVFIFIRTDCPISNHYAPEIERLKKKYAQHIVFRLVYPDRETTVAEIEAHLKDYGLSAAPLRDPSHQLVRKAKVKVTPEAALFLPDGREVYHGRIDDRYVDFGKERPAPTRRDLDDALQAVVQGKPVAQASTSAVGCYITELP
jgi:thiol-disulfide isomerase/thioredoxin